MHGQALTNVTERLFAVGEKFSKAFVDHYFFGPREI